MIDVDVEARDGLALLRSLPTGAAAAVVTDPPWNRHQDYGELVDDARPGPVHDRWLQQVLEESLRVAADAVVLLAGTEHATTVTAALATRGVWWRPLQWRPPGSTVRPPATIEVRDEPVVWASHHAPALPDTSPIRTPVTADPYLSVHPCPKPVALFAELLVRCVQAPGSVVDPFAGTGAVLAAACAAGRAAIGADLNPSYCRIAKRRVGHAVPTGGAHD